MPSGSQNNADANSSAVQPARDFPNMSVPRSDRTWQFRAPMLQSANRLWTHKRRPPLPATLDAYVCGQHIRAQYRGHGVWKVVYLLETVHPDDSHPLAGKVLKLCKETDPDPEPKVFADYERSGVYPRVFATAPVLELDSVAQPVCGWHGWVTVSQT